MEVVSAALSPPRVVNYAIPASTLHFCWRFCSTERSTKKGGGLLMAAAKRTGSAQQADGRYKGTVDLPQTNFGLKANAVNREPELQQFWEQKKILDRILERSRGEVFTLHDGPPYANGDLHVGHALNKILKDFINRYYLLQGRKVLYVPGWDCHGLPIELKVLQSLDPKTRSQLNPVSLRKQAAEYALKTVDAQRRSFKRYGVWGAWDKPYLTLSPEYEAAQIGVFGEMVLNGYIYRGLKPVHWSPSSGTALAEAELEYPDKHYSRSIYAVFKVTAVSENCPHELRDLVPDLGVAIWTTTPWTIPGNAAVAVNDRISYAAVEILRPEATADGRKKPKHGLALSEPRVRFIVVAEDLVPSLQAKWNVPLSIKTTFLGSALELCRYQHPLEERTCPIVIGGDYITTASGTGLVHTAPGHGQEDFITGQKCGLPVLSPVDDKGIFTDDAKQFAGKNVLSDGNEAVIRALDDSFSLLMEERYEHKYPYDWRTKQPTIFRATEQWFASVEGFMSAALAAVKGVQWFPPQGENRITSMISGRKDWCISRQRSWGVPIPVFYDVDTGEPLLNKDTISYVQSIIARQGSDAWWTMTVEDLLPEAYRDSAQQYRKGTDTMDVWFDSGTSWAAVLRRSTDLNLPADLYLEGSDQHRGWFQSSLLTSVATTGSAPYRQVLTHGFVLDDKGIKMAKSAGNVVDPRVVIEGGKNLKDEPPYGADVLRLWVCSVDYSGDVSIGPLILRQIFDVYRKFRATLRYLLSNLHDWKPHIALEYEKLPMIDKYALFQLATLLNGLQENFEKYQFVKIYQLLQHFAVVDLSNFYLDISKDRLYVGGRDSYTRRSCQTVLATLLLSMARAMSAVLPHLAEDAWQNLPFAYLLPDGSTAESVFEAMWPEVNPKWLTFSSQDLKLWGLLGQMRTEVNKVLELARADKLIGANLDAKVYVFLEGDEFRSTLEAMAGSEDGVDKLHMIFLTSQVDWVSSEEEAAKLKLRYAGSSHLEGHRRLWIGVDRADGNKCERCWKYSTAVGCLEDHPTLCSRCHGVVLSMETTRVKLNAV